MNGCDIVGDGHRPTGKFKIALFENGVNLCDLCPLKDCIATERQAVSLRYLEKTYKDMNAPECDKRIMETRETLRAIMRKQEKRERRNPSGRKRGRPRKNK